MLQRLLAITMAGLLAMLVTGCATAPSPPARRSVVPLATEGNRALATVTLLDEVVVELPAVRVPGHQWTIVANDLRFLQPIGAILPRGSDGFVARFRAIRSGRRQIRFLALAPAVREAEPSQAYVVTLQIEPPAEP